MDPYVVSLLTGAVGMGAMALGGVASHGHSGGSTHGHVTGGSHGHVTGGSHGHVAHGASAHVGAGSHDQSADASGGYLPQVTAGHGGALGVHHTEGSAVGRLMWAVFSPRVLFSVLIGLGTTGVVIRPLFGGLPLFILACAGGVLFERIVVAPVWNLALRFASRPALSLESAVTDEATVVTSFNANGEGMVEIELDGRMVRVLGTLQPPDLAAGVRPRTGQRVRIEAVDSERNRCTVSAL